MAHDKPDYEQILRDHVKKVDAIFAEWKQLCKEKGWKSGLSK